MPNDAVGELLGLLNGYSYANGNPVNMTDPSGMFAIPSVFLMVGSREPATLLSSGTLTDPSGQFWGFNQWYQLNASVFGGLYLLQLLSFLNVCGFISVPAAKEKELDPISDDGLEAIQPSGLMPPLLTAPKYVGCTIPPHIPGRQAPRLLGIEIEHEISDAFVNHFGPQRTTTQSPLIPGARADGSGRAGRPDLVLWDNYPLDIVEIYEIKPISWSPPRPIGGGSQEEFERGVEQLERYVDNWWRTDFPHIAYKGTSWDPNGWGIRPYKYDSRQEIVLWTYYFYAPGMIYYSCRDIPGGQP